MFCYWLQQKHVELDSETTLVTKSTGGDCKSRQVANMGFKWRFHCGLMEFNANPFHRFSFKILTNLVDILG